MSDAVTGAVSWSMHADDKAVADHVAAIVAQPGARRLAVPGGKTPLPIFADLARRALPWGTVTLMLTDDRQVPPGHPASNQGKLEAAFDATAADIIALKAGMATDRFDLVWLGMGADGHIASLFPAMQIDVVAEPAVVHTLPDPLPVEAPFARLSLNMAALLNSDAMMIVVRGDAKKRVLDGAIKGEHNLPIAQLLAAAHCPVHIFWSPA
jgi:6-phosphogluconolactonase